MLFYFENENKLDKFKKLFFNSQKQLCYGSDNIQAHWINISSSLR